MTASLESVHPVLMSKDIGISVQFYARLGFELLFQDNSSNPKYAVMKRDGAELHFQWQASEQWSYPIDRPAYRFKVTDVDALYLDLLDRGGITEGTRHESPWTKPADTPWGTREFHLRDPGQNSLQFYRARNAGAPHIA
ncbi:MAG: VOC family protein [Pseudomonadota bacterium]